jgi:transcriptional regulator with XRE-family HTH domain
MSKKKTLMDDLREERERDPELDALYQRELAKLQLANQIVRLRTVTGMTQAELGRRIGTHQAGVARMERSTYRGYTVGTLAKIAAATGAQLEVRLHPRSGRSAVSAAKKTLATNGRKVAVKAAAKRN